MKKFEKDFFKLMNNAVYVQTLMDVTKFHDFELVNSQTRYHCGFKGNITGYSMKLHIHNVKSVKNLMPTAKQVPKVLCQPML